MIETRQNLLACSDPSSQRTSERRHCTVLPESEQISVRSPVRYLLQRAIVQVVQCLLARRCQQSTKVRGSDHLKLTVPFSSDRPFLEYSNACGSYATMPASTLTGSLSRPIVLLGARRKKIRGADHRSVFPDTAKSSRDPRISCMRVSWLESRKDSHVPCKLRQ
jgi:hypothetical protein